MAIAPSSNVGRAATARSIGAHLGSMVVPLRNAPAWLRGFANQARQSLTGFKPSFAMRDGSGYGGSLNVHRRPVMVSATGGSDVVERLESALKVAEDCVGECLLEWENVEELSAQVADNSFGTMQGGQLSTDDMEIVMATTEKLAAARESMTKETGKVDTKVLKEIAEGMKGLKHLSKKVSKERLATLEEALREALDAAVACSGDECVVLWDTFDELNEARKTAAHDLQAEKNG